MGPRLSLMSDDGATSQGLALGVPRCRMMMAQLVEQLGTAAPQTVACCGGNARISTRDQFAVTLTV